MSIKTLISRQTQLFEYEMELATSQRDFALYVALADDRISQIAHGAQCGSELSPAAELGGGSRTLDDLTYISLDHSAFDLPRFMRAESSPWNSICRAAGQRLGAISQRMEQAGRDILTRVLKSTDERAAAGAIEDAESTSRQSCRTLHIIRIFSHVSSFVDESIHSTYCRRVAKVDRAASISNSSSS
jgi:hypothetical protein